MIKIPDLRRGHLSSDKFPSVKTIINKNELISINAMSQIVKQKKHVLKHPYSYSTIVTIQYKVRVAFIVCRRAQSYGLVIILNDT